MNLLERPHHIENTCLEIQYVSFLETIPMTYHGLQPYSIFWEGDEVYPDLHRKNTEEGERKGDSEDHRSQDSNDVDHSTSCGVKKGEMGLKGVARLSPHMYTRARRFMRLNAHCISHL